MAYNEQYRTDPRVAFLGMVSDQSPSTILSRTVETDPIGFGLAVKQGSEDFNVAPMTAGDTAVFGITVRNQSVEPENDHQYPIGYTAGILVEGSIWVNAGEAATAGDPVFVVDADGSFAAAAGAGRIELAGAFYETSAAAGELVRVRIV